MLVHRAKQEKTMIPTETESARWVAETYCGKGVVPVSVAKSDFTKAFHLTQEELERDEIKRSNGKPSGKKKYDHVFHTGLHIAKREGWLERRDRGFFQVVCRPADQSPRKRRTNFRPASERAVSPDNEVDKTMSLYEKAMKWKRLLGEEFDELSEEQIKELLRPQKSNPKEPS